MEPEEAWRSSKLRAWGVGAGLGVVGAIVSSIVGLFAGLCCLFQFANAISPLVAGILGGLLGSALGRWSEMPGMGGPGAGAFLGLRAGGLAAFVTGLLGFTVSLLWPVVSAVITAATSSGDIMETLMISAASVMVSALMSGMFTIGGVVVGVVLGVAAGAIMGAIRGT